MRTTLKIDDDILEAAKALAHYEKRSIGEIISSLARPPTASACLTKSTLNINVSCIHVV